MSITSASAHLSNDTKSLRRRITISAPARMAVYAGIIAALVYGLWLLVPQDPFTYRAFRARLVSTGLVHIPTTPTAFPPRSAEESTNDPVLNAALPIGGVFDQMRKAAKGKTAASPSSGYLVVYVGDCASCLAFDVQACKRDADQHHLTLVLLTTGTPEATKLFQKRTVDGGLTVSDPQRQIVSKLNAAWQPRCYLFSSDWHLRWLQKNSQAYYNPFANADFLDVLKQVTP